MFLAYYLVHVLSSDIIQTHIEYSYEQILVLHNIDTKKTYALYDRVKMIFYFRIIVSDIILEPIKQGTNNVALIFILGAELLPGGYIPLVKQVQLTSSIIFHLNNYVQNLSMKSL